MDGLGLGRRELLSRLYVVGFLDLFGVSLIVPLLNRHIKCLGGSSTTTGLVGSVYGILQLFSGTVIGSWSDVVGRQRVLLVCLILSGLSYGLLGISSSIFLLILARIPMGIFKQTQSILKAILSDLVSDQDRTQVLGMLNGMSRMGFILGPVLGGYLVELDGGFYINSFICSFIFFLNAGAVWCLPYKEWLHSQETSLHSTAEVKENEENCTPLLNQKKRNRTVGYLVMKANGTRKSKTSQSLWSQCLSVGQKIQGVVCSNLWDVFLVRFLMSLAVLLYYNNFFLAVEERFGVSPRLIGYLISYGGMIGALSGFTTGYITRLYNNNIHLMKLHSSILTFSVLLLYSITTSIWVVVFCTTVFNFSTTIGSMCTTAMELSRDESQARGTLIGAGQSVTAVSRILASILSGIVQEFNVCGPPKLGAALALLAIFIMIIVQAELRQNTKIKLN
ncbi:major facilitator superfamily domain-containing protein 9 [Callorhinchus milii]|uniref:Major facilitator superfamily domain containing 9 n=1 Tax=Callorhinchus milii TaxID=7868 RepID=A0A4W3K9Q3_CALMI|nr:major facilitator superfamily domain-containing protein 9 [Callorhinchus milii]|eukprot:gi/632939864/ref/XP_007883396.1/ PREDICTED: major facilitator superfamily domain-containing protein 9 isoform X1 [Callorhinchus milii]